MVEELIFRQPTPAELRDFKPVGMKTYDKTFQKKLEGKEQEFTKAHKPFCKRCARLEFKDKVDDVMREIIRKKGYEDLQDIKLQDFKFDLETFGEASRFKFIKEIEVIENVIIAGSRTQQHTGYWFVYECNARGCKHSVFIPLNDYEERKRKEKTLSTKTVGLTKR